MRPHFLPQVFPAYAQKTGRFGPVALAGEQCLLEEASFGDRQFVT
jgi:hypothetical protein